MPQRTAPSKYVAHQGGLVGWIFLAGLVVLGGLQRWWLQPIVAGLEPLALFFGALSLTAITDNAALTYLGSLIEGISDASKYMLVAGAVAGGGLTVIAKRAQPGWRCPAKARIRRRIGGCNRPASGCAATDIYRCGSLSLYCEGTRILFFWAIK